ncbi:TrlF family AAA-like ATPase [Alkalicoccobacillus gibsonii]|uniref:TrlF family AAA-like ATPase n=1 Tax=Alkalicoccobacillus gibsonii TaxID=79881 RepID=UPI001AED8746|nr:PHP domain-containing protein [Alkalicoccobacillus gibsonii]
MVGNKWFKCDLHLHTPASLCFRDKNVTAEEWITRCVEQELKCVAITDHNTGESIDAYKKVGKDNGIIVFPGVELTYGPNGVHLLILFPLEFTTQDVEDFLISVGINRSNFASQDACSPREFAEILRIVTEKNGIIIPAHVDEYKGLQEFSLAYIKDIYDNQAINGVQVANKVIYDLGEQASKQDKKEAIMELNRKYKNDNFTEDVLKSWSHPVKEAIKSKKAILTFSDNPHGEGDTQHGIQGIGTRYTWIKMDGDPSLESLKQALLLADLRIRSDFESNKTSFNTPNLLLERLIVENSNLNNDKFEVNFSSQMNSIVGGRGTGKSSIVRFIRGILNKNAELKDFDSILTDQQSFYSKTGGVFNEKTRIELIIQFNGNRFKIVSENTPQKRFVYKFNNDQSKWELTDEEYINKYFNKTEIYSQKQIYEIAVTPNALRDKIDEEPNIKELKLHVGKLEIEFRNLLAEKRKLDKEIKEKNGLMIEKKELEARLHKLTSSDYKDVIDKYSLLEEQRKISSEFADTLNKKIKEIKSNFEEIKIKKQFDNSIIKNSDLTRILDETKGDFNESTNLFSRDLNHVLTGIVNEFIIDLENSEWKKISLEIEKEYKDLKSELKPDEIEQVNLLPELNIELSKLNDRINELDLKEKKSKEIKSKILELLKKYMSACENVTLKRRSFLKTVMNNNDNVRIDVIPNRDFKYLTNEIRRIIQRKDGFVGDLESIVENLSKNPGSLEKFKKTVLNVNKGTDETSFSGRFRSVIKGLNNEQIEDILLLNIEDEIRVQYRKNKNSNYTALSSASAGQKTSAILTFLLSYGNSPLILDQPEDDLDNQLINHLIVERLLSSKEKRQVIVITHNANIPVNGDSEWVICLNSESKNIEKLVNGSVDNEEVREKICDVMEGGIDAFKMRASRYGFKS